VPVADISATLPQHLGSTSSAAGTAAAVRSAPGHAQEHRNRRFVMAIDNDKLQEFLGRFVGDLGAR
jgi:hypothetical protein